MWGYIISFVLGFVFHKILPDLRRRCFALLQDILTKHVTTELLAFKKKALSGVKDVKSSDPARLKAGTTRILEIGVGTGTNFQFYPAGCQLVVVDPNPHFKSYYDNNRAKFPQIKSEEIIVGYGEDMSMVEDNSVDVVVVTVVLCSVNDTKKVVSEVKRVLRPGGKFFFLEHIKEFEESCGTKRMLQELLTFTGIWPGLFDGCMPNREPQLAIESAGFSDVDMKKVRAPVDHFIFQIVNPTLMGCATK